MKVFYRYLIVTAVAGLLFLVLYRIFHKDNTVSTNNVAKIIKLQNDTTSHYRDKDDFEHATRIVVTDPNRSLVIAMYEDSLKKLAEKLGIAQSQITQFGQITTELKGSVRPVVVYVDSSKKRLNISWKDPYLSLFGTVSAEDAGSFINYSSRDTLDYIFHNKRQNIFQKLFNTPDQTFDVASRNKRVFIPNISSVIIPPAPDSHIKIGMYAGYGAQMNTKTNGISLGPQIGAGLIYKF
jgi:hypothetical protein